ncbi:MAG TPA: helix-turn-helix transcriptional regulator [Iamia sp.]|nr:helix-turn-helix transcriptional regulator [Iamia sp.]
MDDPLWSAEEPPVEQPGTTRLEDRPETEQAGLDDLPHGATLLDRTGGERGIGQSRPAGPLAHVLTTLRTDAYMADGDVATFARGLGLDPDLARSVIAGERETLTSDEVVSVCEALGCSPSDLWNGGQALSSDAHDPPEGSPELKFVRRRLDQQVREMVSGMGVIHQPPATGEPVTLEVTRYRQADVVAIDAAGRRHLVSDPDQPADPATEYHFTFRRLGATERVTAPLTATAFEQGCPLGRDVEPRLASLAESLDDPGADMVRFRDPASGAEQWIGRETPFDTWQTWDDPRLYYPGDPADILDDLRFADHPELPFESDPAGEDLSDAVGTVEELSIDL